MPRVLLAAAVLMTVLVCNYGLLRVIRDRSGYRKSDRLSRQLNRQADLLDKITGIARANADIDPSAQLILMEIDKALNRWDQEARH